MDKKIIDLYKPAYLSLHDKLLCIESDADTSRKFALNDIAALVLQSPDIIISQECMVVCQKQGIVIVLCDTQRLPCSILLPLDQNKLPHNQAFEQQIMTESTIRKRLWQTVVKAKINNQFHALKSFSIEDRIVERFVVKVRLGDPDNCVGQAARRYYSSLFSNNFSRDNAANGINDLLDYGYAIIRAMMARAIAVSGLNASIGINHNDQYRHLSLADDLMQPFMPLVDIRVKQLVQQGHDHLDRFAIQVFAGMPLIKVIWRGEKITLLACSHILIKEYQKALSLLGQEFEYPKIIYHDNNGLGENHTRVCSQ